MIIDSFAGGGGASLGIAWALGRGPDVAINHDDAALAMHAANHPSTAHVREDVWRAALPELVAGRPVELLWASPDCRHFSRAKGGKPVSQRVRSLAWIVCRWAKEVQPAVIILENVREFADWGPIVPAWRCAKCDWLGTEGQAILKRDRRRCPRCDSLRLGQTADLLPCPKRKGQTFRRWAGQLRRLGYAVAWKQLDAADYGAPTHRRRLFLVARRDGLPIQWPEPTHASPAKLDDTPFFGRLQPWRTAADCIDWSLPCPSIFDRARPLADKTLRRIALGVWRYVIGSANPFIVRMEHGWEHFRGQSIDKPLSTITKCHGHALAAPVLVRYNGAKTPGAGEFRGQSVDVPLTTLDTQNRFGLVSALLTKFRGDSHGQSLGEPLPTITSGAGAARPAGAAHALGLTAASLVRFNHGDKQWHEVREPLGVVTTQGNKFGLVCAFLMKFFGSGGQWAALDQPSPTATVKHRFALVQVEIAPGQKEQAIAIDVPGAGPHLIADIGLRMLSPRELARAQGFPDTYVLTGSKANQVARIGNSVCPHVAAAMVRANVLGLTTTKDTKGTKVQA